MQKNEIYTGYIENGIHYYMHYVPFSETDAGGIVYHGRYFDIAERARSAMLECVGEGDFKKDFLMVIHSADIRYFKPVKIADKVEVQSVIKELKSASMTIEQSFFVDGELKTILNIKVVLVDNDFRPIKVPQHLEEKFNLVKKGE